MSRLLICLVALLLLPLGACLWRHRGPSPSEPVYYHQRGSHNRPCQNTCVRWEQRDRCDGYRRCYPERVCVQYACRY